MKTPLLFGIGAALALSMPSSLHAQCATSGSTLTSYVGGNGQAGTMFDITVGAADMTIECLDVNLRTGSGQYDIEVWYCSGTSVGNEQNPAAWTQLAAFPGIIPVGTNLPTPLDLSGTGMTYLAGQTYGFYVVNNTNYVAGDGPAYTNGGPTTYFGTHCNITTNTGNGTNWGGFFQYREFNGEVHSELAGPAGPSIAVSAGAPGGSMTFDFAGYTASGIIAIVYGPAGAFVVPGGPCAGLALGLTPINASSPILVGADANGDAQLTQNVPAAGAGLSVQAADAATCTGSNVIVL